MKTQSTRTEKKVRTIARESSKKKRIGKGIRKHGGQKYHHQLFFCCCCVCVSSGHAEVRSAKGMLPTALEKLKEGGGGRNALYTLLVHAHHSGELHPLRCRPLSCFLFVVFRVENTTNSHTPSYTRTTY